MQIDGWMYYNKAAIPSKEKTFLPDLTAINDKTIWKMNGNPWFARYISNFDCLYETNWWFIIKDDDYSREKLKKKVRYYVNKAEKQFDYTYCDYEKHVDELYEVYVAAQLSYPKKNRNIIEKNAFLRYLSKLIQEKNIKLYVAIEKETKKVVAYMIAPEYSNYCELQTIKADPFWEKEYVNYGLIDKLLSDYNGKIGKSFFVNDGERNILHETNFQEFLIQKFGFRKAFCDLNIVYKPWFKVLIKVLYPIRLVFSPLDGISFFHRINSVLKMEKIKRQGKKKNE